MDKGGSTNAYQSQFPVKIEKIDGKINKNSRCGKITCGLYVEEREVDESKEYNQI